MKAKILPMPEQAKAYVIGQSFDLDEIKRLAPYQTALKHCKCGTCFCCELRKLVDNPQAIEDIKSVPENQQYINPDGNLIKLKYGYRI